MRCKTHACQMTLLFSSWVCDICDPPKGTPKSEKNSLWKLMDNVIWEDFGFPLSGVPVLLTTVKDMYFGDDVIVRESALTCISVADLVVGFFANDPMCSVLINKTRWMAPCGGLALKPSRDLFDILRQLSIPCDMHHGWFGDRAVCITQHRSKMRVV